LTRSARVYPGFGLKLGYAASRPMEFGLSSPGLGPEAILRPSRTVFTLA